MYYKTGSGGDGFGSFGEILWDEVLRSAGYNAATNSWNRPFEGWEATLLRLLLRRAVTTVDELAWTALVPSMTCASMARSLGLGYDTAALCYRLDPIWAEIQQFVRDAAVAGEAERWAEATCADRAVVDGGGSVCTAADGGTQVRCWDATIADFQILPGVSRCPAGTGGTLKIQQQRQRTADALLAKPRVGTVIGKVVDETGAVVARAKVSLGPPAGSFVTAGAYSSSVTASNGTLLIQKAPGTYDLVVKATGYADLVVPGVVLTDGTVTNLGTLRVLVPSTVSDVVEQQEEVVTCEAGQVVDPATGLCVATEAKTEEEPAWYSSPWVWVIGGVVVLGGGYLAWNAWGKKAA